jgi:hypothetical protein
MRSNRAKFAEDRFDLRLPFHEDVAEIPAGAAERCRREREEPGETNG